ncbi:MAG: arginine deiminase-related protein [Elusimicrobiota bacterium]|jgi:N-dimethylarginine dimethylaminohydrolase
MNTRTYAHVDELKGFSIKNCPSMPQPGSVLMCPPDYYDVSTPLNPYMAESVGKVDKARAREQWGSLRTVFERLGKPVRMLTPAVGLEDMVFVTSQTLLGLTARMEKVCLLGHMRHPSRRGEVAHFDKWFQENGYRTVRFQDPTLTFEGMSDSVWHPGKRLLWGGHGFRTDPEVYELVAGTFESPVILLKLVNERFYHLDTCFCPLGPEAVLIYPPAFSPESLEIILRMFPVVLAADEREAARMVCNSAIVDAHTAIVPKGVPNAVLHLKALGMDVLEADVSEFVKSGGSVSCLKMMYF